MNNDPRRRYQHDTIEIRVLNHEDAEKYVGEAPYCMISITEPGRTDLASFVEDSTRIDLLRVEFSDMDSDRYHHLRENCPVQYKLFDRDIARSIINFYQNAMTKGINKFVIHCAAGISRSPAVAASIAFYETGDDEFFWRNFIPNSLVYRIMLQELFKGKDTK